jgi:hypothetical protein
MAAIADASTTLTAITIGADHLDGFRRRLETKPPNFVDEFRGRQGIPRAHSMLDDRQQLTLQRAMVPLRTFAEPTDDLVGSILDGKIHGHDDSKVDLI